MASKLNVTNLCKEIESTLPVQEYALGKGLLQPFNNCNSGGRKIMQGTQTDQTMQLEKSEVPIIMTGYENRYAEESSTYIKSDRAWLVAAIIPKYNIKRSIKSSNFTMIMLDSIHKVVDIQHRVDYRYISESYGYSMDTEYMDSLNVGDIIQPGTSIIKSNSFDHANNKCSGLNLRTVYMALAKTTEDPVIISKSTAERMKAPLFDSLELQINDNDILLNLFGDNNVYKTFPDIGESTKDGMLCAIRREHKDNEAFYAQDVNHLREAFLTDDKRMRTGIVVDIDVHCNNLEKLENSIYNSQVYKYYQMKLEYCEGVVKAIDSLIEKGYQLTYAAEELYWTSKMTLDGVNSIHDKVFSNIKLDIVTMNIIPVSIGDKITDRYGGKGVISDIWPDEMMPRVLKHFNGFKEYVHADAIFNNSTIVNRENPGQSFETEITFIGEALVDEMIRTLNSNSTQGIPNHPANTDPQALHKCYDLVMRFYGICNPVEAKEFHEMWINLSIEDKRFYLESLFHDENIFLCMPPMSSGMSLDKLNRLYKEFPWIDQVTLEVPVTRSNGRIDFIPAYRKVVFGKKYVNRLKQFAEEKFSAVSLAATNIKGENVKSNANKLHKAPHATTPVRFGDMEFLDMLHMNGEINIQVLLLVSAAPKARRMFEQLLIGDPFVRDIRLPSDAKSRQVEKVDVYLKEIGLALKFTKRLKKRISAKVRVMTRLNNQVKTRVVREINPLIQDNIKDIAKERMTAKDRAIGKIRAIRQIDKQVAKQIQYLPLEMRREILTHGELTKNVAEVSKLIDRANRDQLVQILNKDYSYLINTELPKEKIRVFKQSVLKEIPGIYKR